MYEYHNCFESCKKQKYWHILSHIDKKDIEIELVSKERFRTYYYKCQLCLTSEMKIVKSYKNGIPYIGILTKIYIIDPDKQMKIAKRNLQTDGLTHL